MKWLAWVLVWFGLGMMAAHASDAGASFAAANEQYMQGHFSDAAQQYRQAIDAGGGSGTLWYDLGNCYYQLGDVGRARLCYERAVRMAPRDADVRHNLVLLKHKLAEADPVFHGALLAEDDPLQLAAGWFTETELAALTSLCYFAAALALWSWLRMRRSGFAWGAGAAAFVMLVWGSLLLVRLHAGTQAVVLQPTATLYNGPGKEFTAGLALRAGTVVSVERRDGDWTHVTAYGRAAGWLRDAELEQL